MMKKIDHILQFKINCSRNQGDYDGDMDKFDKKDKVPSKLQFLMDIFETCEMTQTFVFLNSINYAESIFKKLNKAGLHCEVLYSKLSKE